MSDEWKRRLEQVTGAVRVTPKPDAPETIRYGGHLYTRMTAPAKKPAVTPSVKVSPYEFTENQVNFTQTTYKQSWYGVSGLEGAALYLEMTPVVPNTLEVYLHPLGSGRAFPKLAGRDDGRGLILPTDAGSPLAGTIYYNDGEVAFHKSSYFWKSTDVELLLVYNRLEVAQARNRTARGGSIVSVNED